MQAILLYIFERAFKPLVDLGVLQICYGGAELGGYLIGHPKVDAVHMTGSERTYNLIKWGSPKAPPAGSGFGRALHTLPMVWGLLACTERWMPHLRVA